MMTMHHQPHMLHLHCSDDNMREPYNDKTVHRRHVASIKK